MSDNQISNIQTAIEELQSQEVTKEPAVTQAVTEEIEATKKSNKDNKQKRGKTKYTETLQNLNNLSVPNLKKVIAKAQVILEKKEAQELENQEIEQKRKENIKLVNMFLQEHGIKGLKIS